MADSRFFLPTPSFNALRLLLWTVLPIAGFWALHGGYFAWDGYQTALEGWDLVGIHAFLVGLPCAPQDAAPEVKNAALYVSPYSGGHGCVRDLIEQTLRVQGKWGVGPLPQ